MEMNQLLISYHSVPGLLGPHHNRHEIPEHSLRFNPHIKMDVFVPLFFVLAALVVAMGSAAVLTPDLIPDSKFDTLKSCLIASGVCEAQIVARDDSDREKRALYEDLNWQWNTLHRILTPMAYLVAESDSDVSAAVRCCVAEGVRVVARSGGHSYLKYGFGDNETLVVDLQRMNGVSVDPVAMVATIGAGARGGKVQHDLWVAGGFVLPLGLCPTVGIAGYTLGGGYGLYSRFYGLGADSLLEAELVDATGTLRVVNATTDPDLFWSLRGGGGGNFGIVTQLKFKIFPAPSQVVWAVARWPLEEFPLFFKSWQAWVASSPPPPHHLGTFNSFGAHGVTMQLYNMAGSRHEVEQVIATSFPPLQQGALTVTVFSYTEFMLARAQYYSSAPMTDPAQLLNLTRHNAPGWKVVKSIYVDRVLERDEDVAELHKLLKDYSRFSAMGVEQYGGVIDRLAPEDTAFVHRGMLYEIQVLVYKREGDGEDPETAAAVEGIRTFFEATKAPHLFGHTQSYQNYLDEDLPDWQQRYYGGNLGRLRGVKKRVDPRNVFWNPRSIPPSKSK